jgi:hypothetical protein
VKLSLELKHACEQTYYLIKSPLVDFPAGKYWDISLK